VSPGELQDDVRSKELEALEETRSETLVVFVIQEPADQLLGYVNVTRLGRILHCILGTDDINKTVVQERKRNRENEYCIAS